MISKNIYEVSLLAVQILGPLKTTWIRGKFVCQVQLLTFLKRWNCAHFFDFHEKKKACTNSMLMLLAVSPFTVPSNARLNSNFKMTLDISHNANLTLKYTFKCIVLVK